MKRIICGLMLCFSVFGQSSFTMRVQNSGSTVKTAASYLVLNFSTNLTATASGSTVSVAVSGLGSAAALNTGTSGATIPLLNTANTWSAAQTMATWTATGASGTTLSVSAPTGATANYSAVFTGGNVGIGTTSPGSTLDIAYNNSSGGFLGVNQTNSNSLGKALYQATNNSGVFMTMGVFGSAFGVTQLQNQAVLSGSAGLTLFSDGAVGNGGTDPIIFATGGYAISTQERMRITSTGNVGIGTTSPVSTLHIGVAPVSTAKYGTVSIGSGPFDGTTAGHFVGSANGTQFSINAASGSTADIIMAQVAGVTQFNVTAAGVMTLGGSTFVLGGHTCSIVATVLTCP